MCLYIRHVPDSSYLLTIVLVLYDSTTWYYYILAPASLDPIEWIAYTTSLASQVIRYFEIPGITKK